METKRLGIDGPNHQGQGLELHLSARPLDAHHPAVRPSATSFSMQIVNNSSQLR